MNQNQKEAVNIIKQLTDEQILRLMEQFNDREQKGE